MFVRILSIIALWFAMMMPAIAAPDAASAPQTAGQVKQQLVDKLVAQGYMSAASAAEVSASFAAEDKQLAAEQSWTSWLSWATVLKVIGVVLLLIAFGSTIMRIIKGLWELIVSVPMYVYQGVFGAATVAMTIVPQMIWPSQAFFVALFGAFGNLFIIGWVVKEYPRVQEALKKLFNLGIPEFVIISAWLIVYFGVLAVTYDSQVFGFFTTVSISALFGFGLFYSPGVLFLTTRDKAIPALIWSHFILLTAYGVAKINGVAIPHGDLFAAGVEYYWSIALGVAFLITMSPWSSSKDRVASLIPFTISVILATIAFTHGLASIGTVIGVFTVLVLVEWVLYASWSGGLIIGSLCSGLLLFGGGLLIERYGRAIMTAAGF